MLVVVLSSDEVENPDVDDAEEVVDNEAGLRLELSRDLDVWYGSELSAWFKHLFLKPL